MTRYQIKRQKEKKNLLFLNSPVSLIQTLISPTHLRFVLETFESYFVFDENKWLCGFTEYTNKNL